VLVGFGLNKAKRNLGDFLVEKTNRIPPASDSD
jgi:hypothetical protein